MHGRTWQPWLVPGGLLLALVAALVNSSLFVQVAPSLSFYYVAVFAAGLLLAWRFNSSRLLFSLLALLLAHRAVAFFSNGPAGNALTGTGRTAVALAALLIPLNFIAFAQMRERGLTIAGIAPRFGLLFLESVVFAVLCRPENSFGYGSANPVHPAAFPIPALVCVVLARPLRGFLPLFLSDAQADRARIRLVRGRRLPVAPIRAGRQNVGCLRSYRCPDPGRVTHRDFLRARLP